MMQQEKVVIGDIFSKYDNLIAQIVAKACTFDSEIYAIADNARANLKSIMGIMAFNWNEGTPVLIKAEGKDAEDAVKEICEYLECK